jgi:hypothetical protein
VEALDLKIKSMVYSQAIMQNLVIIVRKMGRLVSNNISSIHNTRMLKIVSQQIKSELMEQ